MPYLYAFIGWIALGIAFGLVLGRIWPSERKEARIGGPR